MKRYIDFVQKPKKVHTIQEETTTFISVPEKSTATVTNTVPGFRPHFRPDFGPIRKKPLSAARPAAKPAVKPAPKPVENYVEKPVENSVENTQDELDDFDLLFGVIEDYHPVKQPPEIAKRPLSTGDHSGEKKFTTQNANQDANKDELSRAINAVEPSTKPAEQPAPHRFKRSPFIRTSAIEKRPLSNSVAPKKVVPPVPVKEEPSDPATIIEKPEKDAHVGIIVTVILTIVFGAAIGTAAFLLLPK